VVDSVAWALGDASRAELARLAVAAAERLGATELGPSEVSHTS